MRIRHNHIHCSKAYNNLFLLFVKINIGSASNNQLNIGLSVNIKDRKK